MTRRKPSYIDVVAPKVARAEHAIAARMEPQFVRAFTTISRSIFDVDTRKRVRRLLEEGQSTIEEIVNEFEWLSSDLFVRNKWDLYADAVKRAYVGTSERSGNAALKELGLEKEIRFEVKKIEVPPNPFSLRWIEERAGGLIASIDAGQKDTVRGILFRAFGEGARADDIMDRLSSEVGLTPREAEWVENRRAIAGPAAAEKFSDKLLKARGRRIARTEIKAAISQGQSDSWQMAQEEGALSRNALKRWVSMPESPRLSKICRELDGQTAPLNESFNSSIVGPIMQPPAHPHCRSVLVIEEPEE